MSDEYEKFQRLEELNTLIPEEDDVLVRLDMIQERLELRDKFNKAAISNIESGIESCRNMIRGKYDKP